jgi:hypothetical protein
MRGWLARLWRWLLPPKQRFRYQLNIHIDVAGYWAARNREASRQLRLAANAFAAVVIAALQEESLD